MLIDFQEQVEGDEIVGLPHLVMADTSMVESRLNMTEAYDAALLSAECAYRSILQQEEYRYMSTYNVNLDVNASFALEHTSTILQQERDFQMSAVFECASGRHYRDRKWVNK